MSQCTAKAKSTGERCGRNSILGATVCPMHGGAAPQVKAAAKKRLLEALDPAAAQLVAIATSVSPMVKEADKIRAIHEIFERVGFGEPKTVQVITIDALDAEIMRLEDELGMKLEDLMPDG